MKSRLNSEDVKFKDDIENEHNKSLHTTRDSSAERLDDLQKLKDIEGCYNYQNSNIFAKLYKIFSTWSMNYVKKNKLFVFIVITIFLYFFKKRLLSSITSFFSWIYSLIRFWARLYCIKFRNCSLNANNESLEWVKINYIIAWIIYIYI